MNRHHPSRLMLLPAALSVVFALTSCSGLPAPAPTGATQDSGSASAAPAPAPVIPSDSTPAGPSSSPDSVPAPTAVPTSPPDPTSGPTSGSTPGPTPGATPGATPDGGSTAVALSSFSGTSEDAKYTFDHPPDWTVQDSATGGPPGSGPVSVLAPDGTVLASLTILVAWGAECPCVERPAVHLGDVPGVVPLSKSGEFVVRSMAVDLTEFPEDRVENQWADNVQVVTSLSMDSGPPPAALVPRLMYGLGLVETGVVATNGVTYRTVLFVANRSFTTLAEAQAYATSDEHKKIEAMIASFREGTV
ncbi:hypothetical protein [Pseudarthrobacter sp. TAF60_1]|uniref:hypothetical protein n=1 Tax=Pseudarthrobacter sp. TAF60_1 TaxID=3233071 RepID=UPI003F9464D3